MSRGISVTSEELNRNFNHCAEPSIEGGGDLDLGWRVKFARYFFRVEAVMRYVGWLPFSCKSFHPHSNLLYRCD